MARRPGRGAHAVPGPLLGASLVATVALRWRAAITRVTFHRFKQFRDQWFDLHGGVSLLGGGNNAGESTILHGLAIWEFCRTAIEMERGPVMFLSTWSGQGIGLGDDEFSPISIHR